MTLFCRRIVILLLLCVVVVNCDKYFGIKKKKPHHHHDMLCGAGLLYYLTFLALKVKIAFIIGGVIALVLFFGKIWALVTYGKYMMGGDKHKEPEKIYIQAPSHHDFHGPPDFHGHDFHHEGPSGFDNNAFLDHPPQNYHKRSPNPQAFLDHPPPPNAYMDHPPPTQESLGMMQGSTSMYPSIAPQTYQQRGFNNSILNDLNKIAKFMEKLDITEMAFNSMNLKDDECRRRYVCQVDVRSKTNPLLALGYSIFSSKGLDKYRSLQLPATVEDCKDLHASCTIPEPKQI